MKTTLLKAACFTIAMLVFVTTLTACQAGSTTGSTTSSAASSGTSAAVTTTAGNAPVYPMKTDVKLTYWSEMNGNVSAKYTNAGETPFAKELSKRTGIQVEYIHSTAKESFSLMLASNQLPDIVEYWWSSYPGGTAKALEEKVIISLNDIMEKDAPNYTKWLKDHPDIARQIRWDDGSYVGFPFVNGDGRQTFVGRGPLIRKDLLDKKGLGIPETVDDWYNALLAFKSLGVKAPFTKAKGYLADFIARAYGIQLDADAWYIEDGKVVYGPVQPAYKDFLATWHKWYDEGLIDPDIATVDANIETAKMADGSAAATFNYVSRVYNYNKAAQEKIQGYNIVAAPFPVLKKGDAYEYSYISNLYSSSEVLTVITGNCKHPEIAARFLDYLWGEEGNILANWGIPDVTYTTGANKEPKYTDFLLKNPDGWTMSQVRGGYMRSYSSGPYVQDKRIDIQTYVMPEQVTAVDMWSKNASMKHLMPPIARTAQENTEYATIMSEVETYYKECLLKFMIGTMKLDEYDAYKAQMKNLKIDRAIEIQQAAYNRYISK